MIEDIKYEQEALGEPNTINAGNFKLRRVSNGWVLTEMPSWDGFCIGEEYCFNDRIALARFIEQRLCP